MFVGREKELSALDKLYDENVFQMIVLYSRKANRTRKKHHGATVITPEMLFEV